MGSDIPKILSQNEFKGPKTQKHQHQRIREIHKGIKRSS